LSFGIIGSGTSIISKVIFTKKGPRGYVIVDAPVGASVEVIPSGYKVVVINGKTYYYHNDIYFAKRGKKYSVVSDPVYHVVELPK